MRSLTLLAAVAATSLSLLLGACRDIDVPIGAAIAVEIPFDESVPRRDPRNVHTYSLQATVPREAIQAIADEQVYTYVHVTRCGGGELIAVAETRLDGIDLMDFDALQRKLREDARGAFRIDAKFSSPRTLRSGEACVAFNGGSYAGGQASSPPTPIAVRSAPPVGG